MSQKGMPALGDAIYSRYCGVFAAPTITRVTSGPANIATLSTGFWDIWADCDVYYSIANTALNVTTTNGTLLRSDQQLDGEPISAYLGHLNVALVTGGASGYVYAQKRHRFKG
jgi:hypothetical protein